MSESKVQCLMLTHCREATGIRCENRDFENCDFFRNLIRAAKGILTKKELDADIIILYCFECNCTRKFKKKVTDKYECLTCKAVKDWKG